MSRIGKKIIEIPKGVTVTASAVKVSVKGPKGELHLLKRPEITIVIEGSTLQVGSIDQDRQTRAYQGTARSLIDGMIIGVSKGYEKKLEITGVGYLAVLEGKKLSLSLGFNKPVKYEVPSTVTVDVPNPTTLIIKGCDKQQVGLVADAIRKLRKPEPYKGKGIKYSTEVIRRKSGKAFASGGAS
ncbi:50S ribosomal protein L6 [Planctomycetota bacterium]|jgi:large subunit ribosomal protein L6|nr:50S ribosomal protein L6 [Planctomycetota bacterium]GDY01006.1 50S ribosomal protein L6 [Planctomycetota bacterium]